MPHFTFTGSSAGQIPTGLFWQRNNISVATGPLPQDVVQEDADHWPSAVLASLWRLVGCRHLLNWVKCLMRSDDEFDHAYGVHESRFLPAGSLWGRRFAASTCEPSPDADFAAIQKAWNDHSVLLFRGQQLTDDDLIAFSRRFGDLDWAPVQETGRRFVEGYPEIYVVSNVIVNGEPIGSLGAGEATWHTDMSYLEDPPKASMLYALEVPPSGGNTYFCGMYHAYDSLPDALKRRIEGRMLKHDGTYNSGGYVRQGVTAGRRSDDVAGRLASAGLHASGNQAPRAVSGTKAECLHSGSAAGGVRSAARRAVGDRHARRIRVA